MKRTKVYAPKEIYNVTRPDVVNAPWTSNTWWYAQASALDERNCERQADHGVARIFDHANGAGRVLGYHCVMCGWERAMLVYEGRDEPSAPTTEEKKVVTPCLAFKLCTKCKGHKGKHVGGGFAWERNSLPRLSVRHEGNWRTRLKRHPGPSHAAKRLSGAQGRKLKAMRAVSTDDV